MQIDGLDFIAPHIEPGGYDEAVVFGMISWLWAHSPLHKNASVGLLAILAIPAMRHRQFVLATENGKPVFYCTWAWFDEDAERRYIIEPNAVREQDWRAGDRFWMIDWLAPFGHHKRIAKISRDLFFARNAVRSLRYRKGPDEGHIATWHGRQVSGEQAREYFRQRPIGL